MIDVIAVSYGGAADAIKLVGSLTAQSCADWRLTIVDNSGDVFQRAMLEPLNIDERIEVKFPGKNLGYLGGAAFAVEALIKEGSHSDWFVVTNVDLTFDPNALQRIAAHKDSDLGVIAPSITSLSTGVDQNPHLRIRPTGLTRYRRRILMGTVASAQMAIVIAGLRNRLASRFERRSVRSSGVHPIYAPHGSAMVFNRRYFERGGSLRYSGFLFGEEVFVAEECRRLRLKVLYDSAVKITHIEHGQIGWFRPKWILEESVKAAKYTFAATRPDESPFC